MRYHLSIIALAVPVFLRPASALLPADNNVPVPVSRLIANTSKYIKAHPKDPEGYYTLARVHSIAFSQSVMLPAPTITIVRGNETVREEKSAATPQRSIKAEITDEAGKTLPKVRSHYQSNTNRAPSAAELYHLRESVRFYNRTTILAPQEDHYVLGYAWMIEQGIPYAANLGTPWLPNGAKSSPQAWNRKAFSVYLNLYQSHLKGYKFTEHDRILIEAGQGILRLLQAQTRTLTPDEVALGQRVRETIARVKKIPFPISPIILPLGKSHALGDLLRTKSSVKFDLAGDGLGRRWPWVGQETGIVVWDPKQQGKITSGRQLFGSVTWWVYGYQALAALDNDGNGQLKGGELEGIAIWRDANGNGVSDIDEVKPIGAWGITSLSTRSSHRVQGMPANLKGATTSSGQTLPTYDWMPVSLD